MQPTIRKMALSIGLGLAATTAWAADSGPESEPGSFWSPDFGFGQFNASYAAHGVAGGHLLFGGRGGLQLGSSDRWYMGGGGRGGFALEEDAGMGYGFFQIGNRGALNGSPAWGLDAYTGLAFGGYGDGPDGAVLVGPVAGTALYGGAGSGFDYGLYAEVLLNAPEPEASVVSLGMILGGSGGSRY